MVVDDDAAKRFALKTVLAPLGANVVEAASGADALRQLVRDEVAVVLLDVQMPTLDGIETAKMIRQRPKTELTPIIFVTSPEQAQVDIARGCDLGAVDFVIAPVMPTALLRTKVAMLVQLHRSQQELRRYRNQLEILVQERTMALTAISRELEGFSHSLTHDLRAPLLILDGLSEALAEGYASRLDQQGNDYLERMRGAAERMSLVVDGLAALFRTTSGEMHHEHLDISSMAEEVVHEARLKRPHRDVEVSIAREMNASGDRRLVKILLAHLFDNAWKFTSPREAPRVDIGSELVDGMFRFYVRDNGVGFDMIDAHRLFGPFQRLHSQSEFPGDGIGLATAKRIVNRHGGRIWADGAVGEGSTFYFTI